MKIFSIFITASLMFVINSNCFANKIEEKFMQAGLIDVHTIDKSIKVNLVNSNPKNNYFRENYYNGLKKAYLQEKIAIKLSIAQKHLKSKFPKYSLMIMDAARPRSISQLMYDKMKGTKFEKFVANPQKGSMHNYGIAVDITIIDMNEKEIDMGFSPFYKGDLLIYWNYAKKKIFNLSDKQKQNRKLLAEVMKKAGFIPLSFEWWHFNGVSKKKARRQYSIIE